MRFAMWGPKMNIGLYQSASSLSALERWQDVVAQNITSAQTTGYRKRSIQFSTESAGEILTDSKSRLGADSSMSTVFPKSNTSINYTGGETQPTRRELDVAIQGEGFFEVQRPDGAKVYTRSGEFHVRADRTLVTTGGDEVLANGSPITLLPEGGNVIINADGTMFQGTTPVGKLTVVKFSDNSKLAPVAGGYFQSTTGETPQPVENAELLQGYLENSNVTPLREMVDLVLISRAYEANQKMITTLDQQMDKTLQALG